MSKTWLITGISREKPRIGRLQEYNGEDVYHPNQPSRGQIDECLMQFSNKPVLVIVIDPTGCQTIEDAAHEVKESVVWALTDRSKTDPIVKLIRGEE
jgi:hypothetical protein